MAEPLPSFSSVATDMYDSKQSVISTPMVQFAPSNEAEETPATVVAAAAAPPSSAKGVGNGEMSSNNAESKSPLLNSITKSSTSILQMNLNQSATAFTPILTPDRSGSMVLLSPSRTITETLKELASTTGQQLEEVWDEVGYSPEDRASQLSDLIFKFRDLCEEKIAEERGVAETYRSTINEAREEIVKVAGALKKEVNQRLLKEDNGQTLTDELATLEAALEGLRETAAAARKQLGECRDFLVEAHDSLGLEMEAKWRDIESDLTTERRNAFSEKRAEMKEELATRTAAVIQLVRDCQTLMRDLRIDAERGGSELDRRIAGSLVRSKDDSFIMASKFRSDTCTGISATALEELTKRVAELHGEKRRRKTRLREMGNEIAVLWEKLKVPVEEQRAFTESVQGLGLDTVEKGESELKRLNVLKSQMIGELIDEAREKITELWDQINASPEYRESSELFQIQPKEYTYELLEKHENYISTLRSRLEHMKPILRLIEKREIIVKERMEYEELQKDSDRLKQRGAALTRQLMEEEKMARRIKRDLPRLTEHIVEKLKEWKENNDEDFQYKGVSYFDIMSEQEKEWNRYKEEELHRKLKKKQEENGLSENRFAPTVVSHGDPSHHKRGGGRPLVDAHKKGNVRHPSRHRTRDPMK